jgi:hypothetical protein
MSNPGGKIAKLGVGIMGIGCALMIIVPVLFVLVIWILS